MIKDKINSPFAEGNAVLRSKINSFSFRKISFEIVEHYYECEITHKEFTNSELDYLNLIQVYNQYRDKYGLPFPGQIRSIREKYGLSARKMSEILGLGANSYRLYEKGEVPSIGNGRLILAAEDPGEFKKFLVASEDVINPRELEKINERVKEIIHSEQDLNYSNLIKERIFSLLVPDHTTGYRLPILEKITHLILYFSERTQTWKTKLNKLLFYSDFLSFKHYGSGISGLDYRAINMGPVPANFDKIYELVCEGESLKKEYIEYTNGYYGELFLPLETFNKTLFDESELEVMEVVSEKFKNKKTEEIIRISHQEPAWKENISEKRIISYKDFAFTLKAL